MRWLIASAFRIHNRYEYRQLTTCLVSCAAIVACGLYMKRLSSGNQDHEFENAQLTFPAMTDTTHISLTIKGGKVKLSFDKSTLSIHFITQKSQKPINVPIQRVVWVELDTDRQLHICYLKKYKDFVHTVLRGTIQENEVDAVSQWVEELMHAAYEGHGVKRCRRLKVFVNPHGGKSKAVQIFQKTVQPLLEAAHCQLDVTYTTHRHHAYEVSKALSLDYDAIAVLSGDGLIHEILNGLAVHAQPHRALSIPLAPIPTGSGNGLSLNLIGIHHGFDVVAATLNVLKGSPMKTDLFSFTQGDKRTLSFMSQAIGLMADLDLGTEHLRFLGDARFAYGFIRGLARLRPCPVELSFHAIQTDKTAMMQAVEARQGGVENPSTLQEEESSGLPPLKYPQGVDESGWTKFEKPLLFVYGGQGPYVGRDYMTFPASLPDDGLLDLVAFEMAPRGDILKATNGFPNGQAFWNSKAHYFKVDAYRVKPVVKNGNLSIDGEAFPFEEFQVEVHKGLASFLSMHGHYVVDLPALPKS